MDTVTVAVSLQPSALVAISWHTPAWFTVDGFATGLPAIVHAVVKPVVVNCVVKSTLPFGHILAVRSAPRLGLG